MPAPQLDPATAAQGPDALRIHDGDRETDELRLLSRSPHPYARQNHELLEPSASFSFPSRRGAPPPSGADGGHARSATAYPSLSSRENSPSSDSGTEADDEHFLKGLPAPRSKLHKGLRGLNEVISGTSTPLPSPAFPDDQDRIFSPTPTQFKKEAHAGSNPRVAAERLKRKREIVRRLAELLLLGSLGAIVHANDDARPLLHRWRRELGAGLGAVGALALVYPLRLVIWAYRHKPPSTLSRSIPVSLPTSFDPAPLLYPPAITTLVAALVAIDNEAVLLPNIVLSLCSLPPSLFPAISQDQISNPLHWLLTCMPLFMKYPGGASLNPHGDGFSSQRALVPPETAVLLYPLHQNLCRVLHSLTTTSLLTAELQLLSVALINVLLLSSSPQAVIIQGMLWVGGLDILVLCTRVVTWGISLARVPKWRFRRLASPAKRPRSLFSTVMSWKRVRHDLFHVPVDSSSCSSCEALDDADDSDGIQARPAKTHRRQSAVIDRADTIAADSGNTPGVFEPSIPEARLHSLSTSHGQGPYRRHTLPSVERIPKKSQTHTPSGRKKRSASTSVRAFFALTQEQAVRRKWLYALYVYSCIVGAVFVPQACIGVKDFVQAHALHGHEPIGWALGYLFGDLPQFRFEVVSRNLERWICLPPRPEPDELAPFDYGWAQQLRATVFGEANTRLLICAYCLCVIAVGLLVVFRLSPFYEVDTRRKVFHFMMVAMFAPSIYVDPTFAALALSIVLALFLLLDLLRASQLPPLSKPLASFLAPYVDGRDLRGPVVISHIFLLIGCAIPLWLSLGSLPRNGAGYLEGWEVPTREVAMVAGVVCVGLGDAAASLIGRRYGHRKWYWGGGKSLEGSVAFAAAVFAGLMAAHLWLRVGGWPSSTEPDSVATTASKAGFCASVASLTEAVLTGGNDNVIVPVVLWTCVKSLGL